MWAFLVRHDVGVLIFAGWIFGASLVLAFFRGANTPESALDEVNAG